MADWKIHKLNYFASDIFKTTETLNSSHVDFNQALNAAYL